MNFRLLLCVNVGSSVIKNLPLIGDLIKKESLCLWRHGVYGLYPYLPLAFVKNPKLCKKMYIKFFKRYKSFFLTVIICKLYLNHYQRKGMSVIEMLCSEKYQ